MFPSLRFHHILTASGRVAVLPPDGGVSSEAPGATLASGVAAIVPGLGRRPVGKVREVSVPMRSLGVPALTPLARVRLAQPTNIDASAISR